MMDVQKSTVKRDSEDLHVSGSYTLLVLSVHHRRPKFTFLTGFLRTSESSAVTVRGDSCLPLLSGCDATVSVGQGCLLGLCVGEATSEEGAGVEEIG